MKIRILFISLAMCCLFQNINAQARDMQSTQAYIRAYSHLAVKKMKEYKIPASITLAQGILESNVGKSRLAIQANNHFGIKCYDGWNGSSIRHHDDKKNECFKRYKSVEESYDDHSVFLKRSRYLGLYELKPNDYRGWAKGLQKAGYATDKSYAKKLIDIIETYKLYEFDNEVLKKGQKPNLSAPVIVSVDKQQPDKIKEKVRNTKDSNTSTSKHQVYINNGVACIMANGNESFESIADEFNIKIDKLYAFNDAYENQNIKKGEIIYIQNKKKKAEKPHFDYVVKPGDSLHSISQLFGVKVQSLYSLNRFKGNTQIKVGDNIRLR